MAYLAVRCGQTGEFRGPKDLFVELDGFGGVGEDEVRRGCVEAIRDVIDFLVHGFVRYVSVLFPRPDPVLV